MKKYQHPVLFFTLSLVIPWALWFVVAYWSHQPKAPNAFWTGFFELAGLLAPVGVAAYLFVRDKALLSDLKARFIGRNLLSLDYPLISAYFHYCGTTHFPRFRTQSRPVLHFRATEFQFSTFQCLVCTLLSTCSRRVSLAHLWH